MPKKVYRTPGAYTQETGPANKTIVGLPTSTALLIGTFPKGPKYLATGVRSPKEFEKIFGGLKRNNLSSLVGKQFFDNGGTDLYVISKGIRVTKTAGPLLKILSSLQELPSFHLLLIPETTYLTDREADKIFKAAVPVITRHRAMFLLDPPQADTTRQTAKDLIAWVKTQGSIQDPNVVLYHPRVHVRSQTGPSPTATIPASGTVAGLLSRFDKIRGVWKAPAGTEATLQDVMGLEQVFTSRDIDLLTAANINALQSIPSSGIVAWGARTLSSDPEWKYVPVRRTALFVEASIHQGTAWAVFEPNDEPLWGQIRQSVESFLQTLFGQGAFQGAKPQEAYFVKCGRETTTSADQAAGIVNILVGFAPLKPAEFIVIRIQQKTRPVS